MGNLRLVRYEDSPLPISAADIVTSEPLRESAPWLATKRTYWNYEKEWRRFNLRAHHGIQGSALSAR